MQHISQANVAHISGSGGSKVDRPAEALNCTGWVADDSPVERGNVEENPVGTVLHVRNAPIIQGRTNSSTVRKGVA